MKAFKVYYVTIEKEASMIVLCNDVLTLEEAVANKDSEYEIGEDTSRIYNKIEIPLSNVMVTDLSLIELLYFINMKKGN